MPHGGLGPAPIDKLDGRKLKIEGKCRGRLERTFVQVLDCVFKFELQLILLKIVNESEVSIGGQIFIEGLKIEVFQEILRFF